MARLPLLVSFPTSQESIDLLAEELAWKAKAKRLAADLVARGFPPLVDTQTLPYLFGIRPKFVAAMGRFGPRYYRTFLIAKRTGGVRTIQTPRRALKTLQWWIYDHVLQDAPVANEAHAFVRGRNIFSNARPHLSNGNTLVVDIADFFPTISDVKVARVFRSLGYPQPVCEQLASLCCLLGELPQGAPTSPSLANIIFRPVDERLRKLAGRWNCKYTRYADDLAFSGSRRFSQKDIGTIDTILGKSGFNANRTKSRWIGTGGRQLIAGVVVNAVGQPPRWKRRLWRATFHRAQHHPHEFADRRRRLIGIAAFVKQYDTDLASEYRQIATNLPRE